MTTRRDTYDRLEDLGTPPSLDWFSWAMEEVRLMKPRKPRARLTCSCGEEWNGGALVILRAAEHLALRRRVQPEHRVLLEWITSATMLARRGWRR